MGSAAAFIAVAFGLLLGCGLTETSKPAAETAAGAGGAPAGGVATAGSSSGTTSPGAYVGSGMNVAGQEGEAGGASGAGGDAAAGVGGDAAAGVGGDAAGAGGDAAGAGGTLSELEPMERVFLSGLGGRGHTWRECIGDSACPAGERCYELAAELMLCDLIEHDVATACAPEQTAGCDCMNLSCAEDELCVTREVPGAGGPQLANDCVKKRCGNGLTCGAEEVCLPPSVRAPRCAAPGCRADADCTDGPKGRCSLLVSPVQQSGVASFDRITCVYPAVSAAKPCGQGIAVALAWDTAYYCARQ